MRYSLILFHYGSFQPLWQQEGLIQCGPNLNQSAHSVRVDIPTVRELEKALVKRGIKQEGVLIHYIDPFLIRGTPLTGLRQWRGPRLLVCGDLHHGYEPVDTLASYLRAEFHDSVLLAFNPNLVSLVKNRLAVPVRCLPPGIFRYPQRSRESNLEPSLVHVGTLGPHHPRRNALVKEIQERGNVPFAHYTTSTPEEAAALYASHALVLNIPLNNDLNHRFFEVMASNSPQIVFASRSILGSLQQFSSRADVMWSSTIEEMELLAREFINNPQLWRLHVDPPPYIPLSLLVRQCFEP